MAARMTHGVWIGQKLMRAFTSEKKARVFAAGIPRAEVHPIHWEKDPAYTAGGHYVRVGGTDGVK
jgi:hypothetical protein